MASGGTLTPSWSCRGFFYTLNWCIFSFVMLRDALSASLFCRCRERGRIKQNCINTWRGDTERGTFDTRWIKGKSPRYTQSGNGTMSLLHYLVCFRWQKRAMTYLLIFLIRTSPYDVIARPLFPCWSLNVSSVLYSDPSFSNPSQPPCFPYRHHSCLCFLPQTTFLFSISNPNEPS